MPSKTCTAACESADLTARIKWGDGATTTGTVSGASGAFTVSGTHTYTTPGQDTVAVTLADDGAGTATATATSAATVAGVSVAVSGSAQEGQTLTANPSGSVTGYQWQELLAGTWTNITALPARRMWSRRRTRAISSAST